MKALFLELKLAGKRVWYDKYNNPTAEGMMDGVARSAVFVLFLTNEIFTRPFCLKEIREATRLEKPFIMLYETEPRYTFVSQVDGLTKPTSITIPALIEQCPDDLKFLFNSLVARPNRQEGYEREAMLRVRDCSPVPASLTQLISPCR